ncbi:transcriptional regulator-domain-containing protein [Cryomyces antarcticus]
MPSPLQGLRALRRATYPDVCVCRPCQHGQRFSTSAPLQSGHSRWSTIKHDKGKNDAIKNKQRSIHAHEIAQASKLYGSDPNINPRLAHAIATAKKSGFAKASIEAAIARGQGVSASGAKLESLTIEAILPPSVAVVIDCETDNKLRTLADVRLLIKHHEGSVTPTNYLFAKRGRIVFQKKEGIGADEVLEGALDAGALDVTEDAEGKVVVYTEPNDTKATAETLSSLLGLEAERSDIIWDPNVDTKVGLEDEQSVKDLSDFVEELQEKESSIQGVYMNVAQGNIDTSLWADLQSRISA